ncbi:MAG: amino acid ABC transporter substrate-binding protein [Chloroflexi bacterium]|nr:amino acid ABC transporter substrate-binding protein [Chloroflexota bacterium]
MAASRQLKVGIPVSLTGQFQVQGGQALAGLQAWADDVNHAGGISIGLVGNPRPVLVAHYDDASKAGPVRRATERLITEDRVDLLFGPYSGALTQAAAEVAENHGKLLWNQGGASDSIYEQGFRWVVGVLTPASEYLTGLLPMLREADPSLASLAILRASPGAFSRAVSSGVERQAEQLGIKLSLLNEFAPSVTDFGDILDEVERVNPDVLLVIGRIHNDLRFARQLVERGIALKAVALVAAPIQQFYDALGDEAQGFIGPSQWEASGSYLNGYGPTGDQVLESLGRMSGHQVDYPMVQAYAAGLVAQRCLEVAGTLDDWALRDTAMSQDFSTFYGGFKIDPANGRQIGRSVVIVQWQNGRKVIVWPPEQRKGELVYPWRGTGRQGG